MRYKLIIVLALFTVSCQSLPKTFVLKDPEPDKFYLADSIASKYKNKIIGNAPLIAIDGTEFPYRSNLDTIVLPLYKKDITAIVFLDKESSRFIYGKNGSDGSVIINTIALQQYGTDTIQ